MVLQKTEVMDEKGEQKEVDKLAFL